MCIILCKRIFFMYGINTFFMLSLYIGIFKVISMIKELNIENKTVNIYYKEHKEIMPVVLLNTYGNEGKEIFEKCNELQTKNFILISIFQNNHNIGKFFSIKFLYIHQHFLNNLHYIYLYLAQTKVSCHYSMQGLKFLLV